MAKLNESLGAYQGHERMDHGLRIRTDNGTARVIVYSDAVIRVHINREEADEFSYAVVVEPEEMGVQIGESGDKLVVKTGLMRLEIGKNPVRFRFYTLSGKLLNEDDEAFGTSWIGDQVTTYKKLQEGERFVGLGEKTGNLDRAGEAYTNWNTDYFGYPVDGDPLYATFPFYIGIHGGLAYGIFMDNSHKSHFNFGASNDRFAYFSAEDGDMDYYFIHGKSVREIIGAYTWLTGRMSMPPLWSLGYQQCRYSYYPDKEVMSVARTFREKGIPADVIYLDIHYMEGYKVFTWKEERFPKPGKMLADLKKMGFRTVVIVDPGIKVEEGYRYYEEGKKKGLFVRYPDGQEYSGQVWPGWCHFPDFTKEETRTWWGKSFAGYVKAGLEGFWNDMNEPASWGQQTPDLVEFDYEGRKATHRQARNVYGMQMARSTCEGVRKLKGNSRSFILTRAGYSGVQRYAAIWTGDNVASDAHMLAGVRLVNSLGLTGVPFAGYDIGGFAGEASPALYARWISIGAFAPFARGHSAVNTRDSEPWAYGEEVEAVARSYLRLRYALLPYLYSTFYESTQSGMPVARSLAIDYTYDEGVYDGAYQDQYLFGDAILVAPIESDREISKVYLPRGAWYELYTGRKERGGRVLFVETPMERLPLFIRAGAIIPMQAPPEHTGERVDGVLQVHVYAGEENSFTYYEDDGESYDCEKGSFLKRRIVLDRDSLTFAKAEGDYVSKFEKVKVYFHGFDVFNPVKAKGKAAASRSVTVNRKKVTPRTETFRYCGKIISFDPQDPEDRDPYGECGVQTVEFEHMSGKIVVSWASRHASGRGARA